MSNHDRSCSRGTVRPSGLDAARAAAWIGERLVDQGHETAETLALVR
jgi:hypothetical protein